MHKTVQSSEVRLMNKKTKFKILLRQIKSSESFWAYLFLLPGLIGLIFFTAGPTLAAIAISFSEWDLLSKLQWIGITNYQHAFQDTIFWKSLGNTLYYTVGRVPALMVIPFGLALALNQKIKGVIIFRTIYILPIVSSVVAVSFVWTWMYHAQYGIINHILRSLHLPISRWVYSERGAMPSVIIMSIWRNLGYNTIIFLAGLQGIPQQYYEAAELDGANGWQKIRYITIPLISPLTFFALILTLIGSFQVFEETYMLTEGGPNYATYTLVYYLFFKSFYAFKMGYASAIAVILFLLIMLVTTIQWRLQHKWIHYE